MKPIFRVAVSIGITLISPLASAGEWGLGVALAYYQPPLNGIEREFIGLPYITYQNEHLNIDLTTVSYTLLKSGKTQTSIAGEVRFEGYDPKDSPALTGMKKRNPSFDAGISVARPSMGGELQMMILGDITGTHEGYEARAQYQRPYILNRLLIAPAVGISWLDDALADYYYGVRSNEATSTRTRYAGNSTINTFIELAVGYAFDGRLELLGGVKAVRLGRNIEASPIVDKKYDTSAFSALLYKF